MAVKHVLLDADLSDEEQRNEAFKWALSGVRQIMAMRKTSPEERFINPYFLLDALVHAQRGLKQFKGPDEFKTGGYLCFWMARIKPFRAFLDNFPFYTNEVMALQIGIAIIEEAQQKKRQIPYPVLANLLYDLRYGHNSPTGVTNQFQILYC